MVVVTLAAVAVLAGSACTATAAARASAPSAFVHPGVLVSQPQLDFARTKVLNGEQPWSTAYEQMMRSRYAASWRAPKPRRVVECGSYSRPNHGCTDEREDAIAAYTNALAWFFTREDRYARKAIELMDAWSAVLSEHTNSNARLQAAWAGSVWPRAAEIIRHLYGQWPNAGRFARMLRDVYLPDVINGSRDHNGNWELTMMDAAVGISVFLEDRTSYAKAVDRFLDRVPAYIYLQSDGRRPETVRGSGLRTRGKVERYWHGRARFMTGLSQETCRDFTHTGYGLAAIAHVAETSRIQGRDLYPRVAKRLREGLGFHARYELRARAESRLCAPGLKLGLGPVTEIGLNALQNRLGRTMGATQRLTERQRPAGTNNLFVAWETLTHADNPR